MEDTIIPPPCPDPHCDQIAVLLATAALGGALDGDEQTRVLGYVTTCSGCRRRLEGFARVAQALPLSVSEAEPSPALRERIMRAGAQSGPRRQPLRPARPPRRGVFTGALIAMALLLAIFIGQQQLRLQQQAVQLGQQQTTLVQQQQQTARNRALVIAAFGNADSREARLTAAQGDSVASGRVLISPGAAAVVVYAKELPPLAAGRVYQVWLQGEGVLRAVGTFQPDQNDRAWALLQTAAPLPKPEAIFISDEPAPGSAAPIGPELLRASFP